MKIRPLPKQIHHQRGLSLVELMIAIALGIFLIWGVTQSFLTSRQAYRLQQGVGRIQENGRLAQEFIGFDIRNAGDYGCASGDDFVRGDFDDRSSCSTARNAIGDAMNGINMISVNGSAATDFAQNAFEYAVYGFDNDDGGDVNVTDGTHTVTLDRAPAPNTDVLLLRVSEEIGILSGEVGTFVPVTDPLSDLTSSTFSLQQNLPSDLDDEHPIAVSDCGMTKIFAVNAASDTDSSISLGSNNYCALGAFRAGATVRRLKSFVYFVAPSVSGTNVSLYRFDTWTGVSDELLEGVENLQLKFAVDNDGDSQIDSWEDADDVSDDAWNGWDWVNDPNSDGDTSDARKEQNLVRAVRYSLLLKTEDPVLGETQTLVYNGATLPFTDRLLRQVFTSSAGIRSRLNPDYSP